MTLTFFCFVFEEKNRKKKIFLEKRMQSSSLQRVNPNANQSRGAQAIAMNFSAAKGLQEILRTNLGPKGTIKMYLFALFSLGTQISL